MTCAFVVAAAWIYAMAPAARGQSTGPTYHSIANKYSVAFPAGWEPVPDDVLNKGRRAIANVPGVSAGNLTWETGYRPETAAVSGFPMAVMQIQPYPTRQIISEADIKADLRTLPGRYVEMDTSSDSLLDRAILAAETGSNVYDPKRHVAILATDIPGGRPAKGVSAVYYGKTSMIWVMCYNWKSDLGRNQRNTHQIISSFQFDPGGAYEPPTFSKGALIGIGVLVLVVGLIVLIVIVVKVSKRPPPPPVFMQYPPPQGWQ